MTCAASKLSAVPSLFLSLSTMYSVASELLNASPLEARGGWPFLRAPATTFRLSQLGALSQFHKLVSKLDAFLICLFSRSLFVLTRPTKAFQRDRELLVPRKMFSETSFRSPYSSLRMSPLHHSPPSVSWIARKRCT